MLCTNMPPFAPRPLPAHPSYRSNQIFEYSRPFHSSMGYRIEHLALCLSPNYTDHESSKRKHENDKNNRGDHVEALAGQGSREISRRTAPHPATTSSPPSPRQKQTTLEQAGQILSHFCSTPEALPHHFTVIHALSLPTTLFSHSTT